MFMNPRPVEAGARASESLILRIASGAHLSRPSKPRFLPIQELSGLAGSAHLRT